MSSEKGKPPCNRKDKKVIWICLGILAGLYCVRYVAMSYLQARYIQQVQQQRAAAWKAWTDAQQKAQKEAQAKAATEPAVVPVPVIYIGTFAGNALLPPKRGMCIINLTVSPVSGHADQVQGYTSLRCTPPIIGDEKGRSPLCDADGGRP